MLLVCGNNPIFQEHAEIAEAILGSRVVMDVGRNGNIKLCLIPRDDIHALAIAVIPRRGFTGSDLSNQVSTK